jgi:Family of unknown function (DUF6261)
MFVSSKLKDYRLTEAIGFIRDVLQLYKALAIAPLFNFIEALSKSHEALNAAHKREQSSLLTVDIAEADQLLGNFYIGLRKLIEGFLFSPKAQEQKAAELLARSIKHYGIDAHRLNYQAQSTVFDNLIADWQTKPELISAMVLLNVGYWIEALKNHNELIKKVLLNRVQEKATETTETTIELRQKMIQDYRNLVKVAEGTLLLNPSEKGTMLINQQNVLTEQYNLILKKRQGGKTETTDGGL